MKKEISFLVESNSTRKLNDMKPLLFGNTEILEAEVYVFQLWFYV